MVMRDELEFSLEHFGPVPWSNFLLNPRKLRVAIFSCGGPKAFGASSNL